MHARNEAEKDIARRTQSVDVDRVTARDTGVDLEIDRLSHVGTDLSGEALNLQVALVGDRSMDRPCALRRAWLLVLKHDRNSV